MVKTGDTVVFGGKVDVDPVTTGTTKLLISTPVPSGMTGGTGDAAGTAACHNISGEVATITANGGADVVSMEWITTTGSAHTMWFHCIYTITVP